MMLNLKRNLVIAVVVRLCICALITFEATRWQFGLYFLIEMLLITLYLLTVTKYFRLMAVPFLLIHILQFINIINVGYWIDATTLQNLSEYEVIGGETLTYSVLLFIAYALCWVPDFIGSVNGGGLNSRIKRALIIMFILIAITFVKGLPIHKFADAFLEAWEIIYYRIEGDQKTKNAFLRFASNPKNEMQCKNCNLIILFSEGTSSRVISPNLMPNTFNFLNNSLSYTNYYNHQAATFRGIRGSLTSGFTYRGGWYKGYGFAEIAENQILKNYSDTVESLASILANRGYQSVFISPHVKGESLATLMLAVGFDKALSSDKKSGFDSDKETYNRIFKEAERLHHKGGRFLVAGYIVGTHHGLDSNDIKYGDGTNSYKNKFHNQDHWFGEFLNKFKASDMVKDTIVVYTTDHSTYPAKEFQQTFRTNVNVFHDEIPLGIYGPTIKKCQVDAKYRNSLALAPTILDLLGFGQYQNHFLGNSLFEEPSKWERYCAQGNLLFHIDDDGVVRKSNNKEVKKMMKLFYSIGG